MAGVALNVRETVRSLIRSPGFSGAAIATLALGIGSVTALFSVVTSVVLAPLPYEEPDRLVHIEHPVPGQGPDRKWKVSEAGYFFFQEHNRTFEDIAVYEVREFGLAVADAADFVTTVLASGNIFSVLRARPAAGRLLVTSDNRQGTGDADMRPVVLGHAYWQRRFGGAPTVVGQTVRVQGNPVQIVGVVEPGFDLPNTRVDLWLPVAIDPANRPVNWHRFDAIGRLKAGVSVADGELDLERLKAQFPEALPQAYYPGFIERTQFAVEVDPLREQIVGDINRTLWVLLGAVAIVLLIASVNVANLFLVRMETRRGEIALRWALGASARDLGVRYLGESVVVAVVAAAVGLGLADAGLRLLVAAAPAEIPRLSAIGLGWEGVVCALGLALVAGLFSGALPLLRTVPRFGDLQQGAANITCSRAQHRLRLGLVAGEVALTLVLLASAGLLVRTSRNLWSTDPGVDPGGVLAFDLMLPAMEYRDDRSVARFYRRLTERLEALPGVRSVGATTSLPLRGSTWCALVFSDDPETEELNRGCYANPVRITPGYFEAMGIPVRGRVPSWNEMESPSGEVVVSRALADHLWPGGDPIGKGIRGNNRRPPFYRIVGVAGDVRAEALDRPPVLRVYFPMVALEGAGLWGSPLRMTVAVRTDLAGSGGLTPAVHRVVQELNPAVPIGNAEPMRDVLARSLARTSFAMLLLIVAAGAGLLLSTIGLYGVVAYIVAQRRRELGIRIALGAQVEQLVGLVVRQSLVAVIAGAVVGVGGAVVVGRMLGSLLYQVDPSDPLTLVSVSLLLAGVALLASWIPARRVARVDPVTVLRAE